MKHCPTCNRTYPDASLNFCLADGAFLSAADDPQITITSPAPRPSDAPTEILPDVQVPGRERKARSRLASTPALASLETSQARQPRLKQWIVGGALLIGAIAVIAAIANYREKSSSSSNTNSGSAIANSNTSKTETPALANSSGPTANVSNLRGSNSNSDATADTDDYNRTFNANEVTQKARILSKPEPQYTEAARQNQVSGTVVLGAVFSSSGQVTNVRAVRGLPYGLTEKAIAAAQQIRFSPAMKDGRAVSQYIQIEYNFNLY